MRWLAEEIGGQVDVHVPSTNKPHWKTCYRWRVSGKNAEAFVEAVLPHLRIKREQAELLLKFRDIRGKGKALHGTLSPQQVDEREEIKKQMNALNKRGEAS